MKSNRTFVVFFYSRAMLRGNQHGGCKYDDLQNWLHMTSHENSLFNGLLYFWSNWCQRCGQNLNFGWAREEHFIIFLILLLFSPIFLTFFLIFFLQFGPLGGCLRPSRKALAWPLTSVQLCTTRFSSHQLTYG